MNVLVLHTALDMLKSLTKDELTFLHQYIGSTLEPELSDMLHHFIDAQVQFVKDEFKKI